MKHNGFVPGLLLAAALAVGPACGSEASSGASSTPEGEGDGDVENNLPGDGDSLDGEGGATGDGLFGAFTITLNAEDSETGNQAFTGLQGNLRSGTSNERISWELSRKDGDCELLVPVFPFCDPACDSGSTCVVGDVCRPDPLPLSVGEVTLSGLATEAGVVAFSVAPLGGGANYLLPASLTLLYPPADEGASVVLTAPQGEYAALSIESAGIAILEVDATEVPMGRDMPVVLNWSSAGASAPSRMEIFLEISHHGGSKGRIVCDTEDSGALTISASLATELIELSYAGFPTIKFTRKSTGMSDPPHEVELSIVQHVSLPIVIDGLVSCTGNEECPEGQTCRVDKSCG